MSAGTALKAEPSGQKTDQKIDQKTDPATILRTRSEQKRFEVPQSWKRKAGRTTSMIESFYHAFTGIKQGLQEQRNLRIHFTLSAIVIGLGIFLHVDAVSWVALTLAMGLVIGAELLNTAIEHVVDLSSGGEYHPAARKAKDTAAAGVLIAAFAAFAVGVIIFLPKLCAYFGV